MGQIYGLEKAISVSESVNLELPKGYKAVRALLDSAGSKAKKGQTRASGSGTDVLLRVRHFSGGV